MKQDILFNSNKLKAVQKEKIVTVEFINPTLKNAMDLEMSYEAEKLYNILKKNNSFRVLIFRGHEDIFSAGGDLQFLEELTKTNRKKVEKIMYRFYVAFLKLSSLSVVTIAFVNGHAIGAGFSFALSCDLIFVNKDAKLGLNFVKIGINPGMGSEFWVKRLFSFSKSNEILFTGKIYKAEEFAKYNIFNAIDSIDIIEEKVYNIAKECAKNSKKAIAYSKNILSRKGLKKILRKEAKAQASCFYKGEVFDAIQSIRKKEEYIFTN